METPASPEPLPHGPPMRFSVEADGAVVLPASHPLAEEGLYRSAALVELAAQRAGAWLSAVRGPREGARARACLVDVRDLVLERASARAGERLTVEVTLERDDPRLPRLAVRVPGLLSARLTLTAG